MMGYSSAMASLAEAVRASGRQDLRMTVATSNAEPLYDYQRTTIAEAFQCPVRETYGMGEIVVHASECTVGRLHLWPEVGKVEIMDDGSLFTDDRSGELVCTGLFNVDMPLIRYKVGDRAKLQGGISTCGCGRSLPEISRIEGRSNDVLIAPDGRRVYWINPVFYGLPVREAQIVQEELERLCVRYVPAMGWTDETKRSIIDRIQARMGKIEVSMERVESIPRGANGKFRAVVSKIFVRNSANGHVPSAQSP